MAADPLTDPRANVDAPQAAAAPPQREAPVFVVGSSRSGTTLLYSILQASGRFALYEAETFLLERGPARYGDLGRDRNFEAFLGGWLGSEQFRRSGLDPERFTEGARRQERSYAAILRYFMDSVADAQGRARWVEKTPSHVFHLAEVARGFSDARVIHLVRDGRDVALSKRKLGWTGVRGAAPLAQLVFAAKTWEAAVREGRRGGEALGDRYLECRYEDLVGDPDAVLERLSAFLGIPLEREALEQSGVGALGRNNTVYGDKSGGISGRAVARWRRDLSPREQAVLERAVGPTLRAFGYGTGEAPGTLGAWDRARVAWWSAFFGARMRLRGFLKRHTPLGRWFAEPFHPAAA
jgi:hypothetical protein